MSPRSSTVKKPRASAEQLDKEIPVEARETAFSFATIMSRRHVNIAFEIRTITRGESRRQPGNGGHLRFIVLHQNIHDGAAE